MHPTGNRLVPVLIIFIFALLCYYLLAANGTSLHTAMSHDTFTMIDGGYRIAHGQIPHLDFHQQLGPFTYLLVAPVSALASSYGSIIPIVHAIGLLFFLPPILYFSLSRFGSKIAFTLSVYLLLVLIVPYHLSEKAKLFSLANYYNRFCWVALALAMLTWLPPINNSAKTRIMEGCALGALLLFMFYMKITYFALAFPFFALLSTTGHDFRKKFIFAFLFIVSAMLLIEFKWRGMHAGYLNDILLTIKVNHITSYSTKITPFIIMWNSAQVICFGAAVYALHLVKPLRWQDHLFFWGSAVVCIFIMNQNYQTADLTALAAPLAIAVELVHRSGGHLEARPHKIISASVLILMLIFMAQPSLMRFSHLIIYYNNNTSALEVKGTPARLKGFYIQEDPSLAKSGEPTPLQQYIEANGKSDRLFSTIRQHRPYHQLLQEEYLLTVINGVSWLTDHNVHNMKLSVLDFVNPFSAIMDLPPPKGDYIAYHKGRNFDRDAFLPPSVVFGDVDIVMIPKYDVSPPTRDELLYICGDYLRDNFSQAGETSMWYIWARKGITPS